MKNKETYIVCNLKNHICYFKNGDLHREDGPAFFPITDKDKYFNPKDKKFWLENALHVLGWAKLFTFSLKYTNGNADEIGYMLDGVKYDKLTWESIVEKKKLHKDLTLNLSEIVNQPKKPKI
jgi:hypothetical protein